MVNGVLPDFRCSFKFGNKKTFHLHFNYGSQIYVETNKRPLVATQNKLLRILQFKLRKTPLKSQYKPFNVLKLKGLHYLNICCIVHKFIRSPCLLSETINDIFRENKQVHQYNTRPKK